MPEHREPLRIIKAEARKPEGRGLDSGRYSVYLTINRSLTAYERIWINTARTRQDLWGFTRRPSHLRVRVE